MNGFFKSIDKYLLGVFNMKWVSPILIIFLIVYAGVAAPMLPHNIIKYFDLPIVKVLFMAGMLVMHNYSPTLSLMIAVTFMIMMVLLKKHNVLELAQKIVKKTFNATKTIVSDVASVATDITKDSATNQDISNFTDEDFN